MKRKRYQISERRLIMKKVLEVRHLTKRYGQHLALDNVNLTLEKGEVYGLIGRNGQVRQH